MKKYGLLLLMVLVTSTTAWAGPFACVTVDRCVPACEDVTINVKACIPYRGCELIGEPEICVRGGLILVDMYYACPDCYCGGATCIDESPVVEDGLCPGMYIVLVRIHCVCCGPCGFRPRICAMGSTFFQAMCCDQAQPDPPAPNP